MSKRKRFWLLAICVVFTQAVWAGRPIGTDDAGTADAGTCQVESWQQRLHSARALVVAPACGVAPGLEVGFDDTRRTGDAVHGAGVALKWLPQAAEGHSWAATTAFGDVSAGFKTQPGVQAPSATKRKKSTLDYSTSWSQRPTSACCFSRNHKSTVVARHSGRPSTPSAGAGG